MNVFYGIENVPADYEGACVTLGVFDGLHLAHRRIIQQVVETASDQQSRSMLITFEPHPRQVLNRSSVNNLPILTTASEKTELLRSTGLDDVLFLKTDTVFLATGQDEFIADILVKKLKICSVVVGYDYHFGRDRQGNPQTLETAGEKWNFKVAIVPPFTLNGVPVRSSIIRQLLKEGQVEKANELLGWQYGFTGKAIKGSGRGRKLGFPTANLNVTAEKLIPADGIYFVRAGLQERTFYGLLNIGIRKTFNESERVIELYIIGIPDVNLYGQEIRVTMLERLRDEMKFDSAAELTVQMHADLTLCLEKIKIIENETEVCFK
ncbi:MAG: bifunctional riboflavin kinase/FAD synthetase [Candidatus Neomarinimicrobiota bacterium]